MQPYLPCIALRQDAQQQALLFADKRALGRQPNSAAENPELRLEDLSRQIAQLRKGVVPCVLNLRAVACDQHILSMA